MSLDTNAILDAIRRAVATQPPGDGITVPEIAAAMEPSMSDQTVRKLLKRLLADGTMEPCRVVRPRMDGILTICSAYRLRSPPG